jgi:capsular polysaccharide biosynthesis protein
MELSEVAKRIVWQHRLLILCMLAIGIGVATVEIRREPHHTYTASARLVLGTPDPASRVGAGVIADTANAIATTPIQTAAALRAAGVTGRDPIAFAQHHVAVQALGSSGVIQLSVTDRNPRVAAAVANALAERVVLVRSRVSGGDVRHVLADLEFQLERLSQRISALDARIVALDVQGAASPAVRARRDALSRSRDVLAQQRAVLESEEITLLSNDSLRPKPTMISRATPPAHANSSHDATLLALGALLGLIVGVGLAGAIETLRPTLVGAEALARELDAPLLGTLPARRAGQLGATAARLRLGAAAAGLHNVGLVAAGPDLDLEQLAERLQRPVMSAGETTKATAEQHDLPDCRVRPFAPEVASLNGGGTGLVLVSPAKVKKSELLETTHLLRVAPFPLLGVIAYVPRRSIWRGRRVGSHLDVA